MRLINADALLDAIEDKEWVHITDYNIALYAVKDAPTVDAVPVVRCKDCNSFSHGYCRFHDAKFVRPDGYCYWRDEKDGEQA